MSYLDAPSEGAQANRIAGLLCAVRVAMEHVCVAVTDGAAGAGTDVQMFAGIVIGFGFEDVVPLSLIARMTYVYVRPDVRPALL